jgi:hypothetical protein
VASNLHLDTLAIKIETLDRTTLRAAHRLQGAWPGRATIRRGTELDIAHPEQPQVLIGRASLIRPAIYIRWVNPFSGQDAERATAIALTSAAWDGPDEFEAWRVLSRPLPRCACLGFPDFDRNWLLTTPDLASTELELPLKLQLQLQLHVFGLPRRRPPTSVAWLPASRIAASLLGRATAVQAPPGPLAFDALRASIPVVDPFTGAPWEAPRLDNRLAGLVPPRLLADERLWRHVVDQTRDVARGSGAQPLCTSDWIAIPCAGLDTQRTRWERTQRKARKLWQQPARFLADSRHPALRRAAARLSSAALFRE